VARGGPSIPAPLRRARVASLLLIPGGFAPADPPTPSLAGPLDPRAAPAGSRRFALTYSGGLRPRGPPNAAAPGAPPSPRRSGGLASLRSYLFRGASPPRTPQRRRSRGPSIPAPLRRARVASLARGSQSAASRGLNS